MIITEIVMLKSKCYTLRILDREGNFAKTKEGKSYESIQKLKGLSTKTAYREETVDGKIVKKPISFVDYKSALFDPLVPSGKPKDETLQVPVQRHLIHRLASSKQTVCLIKQNKISLSRTYDKRIVAEDDICTFAYGYDPLPL